MRLRSRVSPEDELNPVQGPTRYKKGPNRSELVCGFCHGTYYVDQVTFDHAMSAMEEGLDNPFCCDDCESEQEELSH